MAILCCVCSGYRYMESSDAKSVLLLFFKIKNFIEVFALQVQVGR